MIVLTKMFAEDSMFRLPRPPQLMELHQPFASQSLMSPQKPARAPAKMRFLPLWVEMMLIVDLSARTNSGFQL